MGGGAGRSPAPHSLPLPCQYRDNCIEKEKYQKPSYASLTPSRKKMRQKMIVAIEWMVKKHGLERVGVLTLYIARSCYDVAPLQMQQERLRRDCHCDEPGRFVIVGEILWSTESSSQQRSYSHSGS